MLQGDFAHPTLKGLFDMLDIAQTTIETVQSPETQAQISAS